MEQSAEQLQELLTAAARVVYGDEVAASIERQLRDAAVEAAIILAATVEPVTEWPDGVHSND